ncbi:hypothetical protein Pfo_029331 [Paulownia fortunei]|nr:hypothetical protein Pfo_029331 [Paulownia fortunei]
MNIPPSPPNQHDNEDFLNLSLSTLSSPSPSPSSNSAPPPALPTSLPITSQSSFPYQHHHRHQDTVVGPSRKRRVTRRSSNQILRPGKTETIPPPYPWATARRATIHNLQYLLAKGINSITGRVQCKRCDRQFDIDYDLHKKFTEVAIFIMKNRDDMRHRAPAAWMNPTLPDCKFCQQNNCVKPIPSKKKSINWLFLLLGQMIGCCKLSELKYFCKHTRNHRTGAKDRVLYLTYLELCRQLDPEGPYNR